MLTAFLPELPIFAQDSSPYRNPHLPIEQRVRDLLRKMTLEEKVDEIAGGRKHPILDTTGRFKPEDAETAFRRLHSLDSDFTPHDAAVLRNAAQRYMFEKTRLGIPAIFQGEALHGFMQNGSTSFPQALGLASTWDPDLVRQVFTAAADEMASSGVNQAFTPVLDLARDPRWGRTEETYGEDPYLAAHIGVAAIEGLQGQDFLIDRHHVLATAKHFAVHGQPESGTNTAPGNYSERVIRENFFVPFKAAVEEANVGSVMASYNEIDGVPSHANRWLLRDVLRKEWGFKGFIVSDYYAIWELHDRPDTHSHFVAANKAEACELAVRAGVNIELPEPDCYLHLIDLVRNGALKESQLDELVAPMLYWKFRMRLFDDPYVDPDEAEATVGSEANRELALEAAREVITLLKNEDQLLPLDRAKIKTIAVIGPNADRSLLGGYSGVPKHEVTVLEGIKAKVGDKVKVLYSEGCKITVGGSWNQDEVTPSDPEEDRRQIRAAVRVAKQADVIVLAIGGNEQTSREAWSLKHMGDRTSLDLIGRQDELVAAMVGIGKPVIVLLFNGRPLSINYVSRDVPAILECWYLGQETGRAVADVLFGDVNPGGKLPITIPRSVGHVPAYYNHKPSARRGYLFDEVSPLYAFGYGLSYTTFEVANVRLAKKKINRDGTTRVRADVTNTGQRAGTEVVQMYIRDRVSSVTRPVKELKGFQRLALQPGETRTATFDITPELLSFYDVNMQYTVEPGEFEIMIGTSSRDADLQKVILRVEE
ncbi:MAG: glycoside hydrolase family 3 C-terminal domain-containing protein [Alphaproteobacteria bacterium]|nr:glycoside hydrolase family 3 C-terminal domain-containing protein [Alphaproteobacteria bacterium]